MENQDGHWVYSWCRWVERTDSCEDNSNKYHVQHTLTLERRSAHLQGKNDSYYTALPPIGHGDFFTDSDRYIMM